jgi:hypothetical protein
MKIGFLEVKSDPFISDVMTRLGEFETGFISRSFSSVPITGEWRVVVDRLSFRFPYLRELVKNWALDGAYVINNPFAAALTNKIIDSRLAAGLGIAVPRTVALPRLEGYEETEGAVTEIRWEQALEGIGFPCILKPYDGYAWDDVYTISSMEELLEKYRQLESRPVMLAQQLIRYRDYFRAFCINGQVLFTRWKPRPLGAGEFPANNLEGLQGIIDRLSEQTVKLNEALDLDVNAIEWCFDEEGRPWLIDAFNEVPDFRKESLPGAYYEWAVDKFAGCVRGKAVSGAKNRTVFGEKSSS